MGSLEPVHGKARCGDNTTLIRSLRRQVLQSTSIMVSWVCKVWSSTTGIDHAKDYNCCQGNKLVVALSPEEISRTCCYEIYIVIKHEKNELQSGLHIRDISSDPISLKCCKWVKEWLFCLKPILLAHCDNSTVRGRLRCAIKTLNTINLSSLYTHHAISEAIASHIHSIHQAAKR